LTQHEIFILILESKAFSLCFDSVKSLVLTTFVAQVCLKRFLVYIYIQSFFLKSAQLAHLLMSLPQNKSSHSADLTVESQPTSCNQTATWCCSGFYNTNNNAHN